MRGFLVSFFIFFFSSINISLQGMTGPGSSTFMVIDFFDYESQTTSLISGKPGVLLLTYSVLFLIILLFLLFAFRLIYFSFYSVHHHLHLSSFLPVLLSHYCVILIAPLRCHVITNIHTYALLPYCATLYMYYYTRVHVRAIGVSSNTYSMLYTYTTLQYIHTFFNFILCRTVQCLYVLKATSQFGTSRLLSR